MLRYRTEEGWFLLTHPEHARIAGEFAKAWGNALFRAPFPREDVLAGIRRHDDGRSARDVKPLLTREGKPSAFGVDLVGKYSAFEEIDLAVHAHPTLSEAIGEAVLDSLGKMLHA